MFSMELAKTQSSQMCILSELEDSKENDSFEILENSSKIAIPIQLTFEKVDIPFDTKNHSNKVFDELFSKDTNTISIDYDKVHFPLTIRKKQKGDVFYPIGLKGKKKVSKFFKDEKLSLIERFKILTKVPVEYRVNSENELKTLSLIISTRIMKLLH